VTRRLGLLLVILAGVLAARIAAPPPADPPAVVGAVARNAPVRASVDRRNPIAAANSAVEPAVDEVDVPGNAFPVPEIAAPATPAPSPNTVVPAHPQPVVVQVAAVAPPSAVDDTPPLQVIGTYDDGGTPAIFVATPSGVEIVRKGSVVLAEYQITAITQQNVSLLQLSTQRPLQLAIPGAGS
jgi:hypothetical protein